MTEKVTFNDLVGRIADDSGTSKPVVHRLLKEMAAVANEGLLRDCRVSIGSFGIFSLKWMASRKGANPRTAQPMEIPGHYRVHFKPDAASRRLINRQYQHMKPEVVDPPAPPKPSPRGRGREEPYQDSHLSHGEATPGRAGRHHSETEPAALTRQANHSCFWCNPAMFGLTAAVSVLLLLLLLVGMSVLLGPSGKVSLVAAQTPAAPVLVYPIPDQSLRNQIRRRVPPADSFSPTSTTTPTAMMLPYQPDDEGPQPKPITLVRRAPDEALKKEKRQGQPSPTDHDSATFTGTSGGVHGVEQGDSLWGISTFFYASAYLWPNIFRVNLEDIEDPDVLRIGSAVEVPSLEGTVGSLSHNDIKNIMDGYVNAYLAYRALGKAKAFFYLWVAMQYNVPEVLGEYEERIGESDMESASKTKGSAWTG